MAYDPILRRASARLEEEKRRREDERELLRRQTYAKEPRLAQLDRRLQGTMAELVAASPSGKGRTLTTRCAPSGTKIWNSSRSGPCCWARWGCRRTL